MKQSIMAASAVLAALAGAIPAHAEAGDWILRARAIAVVPQDSSGGITPTFPNEGVAVSTAWAPELDLTYMATNNIGIEVIAGTTKHSANGKTGTTGSIGKLASTWALPPTVTLQYHFMPDGPVRPYLGAGLNYTIFYSTKASSGLEAAVGKTSVSMSNSFGWAVQAGVDIPLTDRIFLNLDVKYIDIDTNARLNTTAIGQQQVRISIDPIVVGFGVGTRF